MKRKILVAGDVEGNFQPLLAKLSGFDVAFCVGKTLALNEQTSSILNGKIKFEKPVFFVDNGPFKHVLAAKFPEGGEICPNLSYLGNIGIKTVAGLTVAFISGEATPAAERLSKDNLGEVKESLNVHGSLTVKKIVESSGLLNDGNEGVDIFLSCQWPKSFDNFVSPEEASMHGNETIEEFAYLAKPRYHFCGNIDKYYERLPYINYDKKAQPIHFTRLIGLGKCPQPEAKAACKYLYAFASQPLKSMTLEQIRERPDNCTENPYFFLSLSKQDPTLAVKAVLKEDDIFAANAPVLTEADKARIDSMSERTTLHVKGFSQYFFSYSGKRRLTKSMSSSPDVGLQKTTIWCMEREKLAGTKGMGLFCSRTLAT